MIFLYDQNCKFCRLIIFRLRKYEFKNNIMFETCQRFNLNKDKEIIDCNYSSYFIRKNKSKIKIYKSAKGVCFLLRKITNSKFLNFIGYSYLLPPINILAELIYFIIKKNRIHIYKLIKKY